MNQQAAYDVRPSPIAGRWYPGNPATLTETVERYMAAPAEKEIMLGKPLRGLLAPHAGIVYSGPVAGQAFRYTRGLDVDIVAIIGPSHYPYEAGLLSTAHSHFETPLGQVLVAHELVNAVDKQVGLLRVRKDPEHAIEIELPFLQQTIEAFELLPLAMLDQRWETAQKLGLALAEVLTGRKALLVASSDLSHFYPQRQANVLDKVVMDAVAAYNPQEVVQADTEGRGFSCGHGAIATVMVAAQALGASEAQVAGYATSGDTSGDMSKVVGYGAALFT